LPTLGIIGGGSWGTALAVALADRFDRIQLWVYEADLAREMEQSRINELYLPGFAIPANVFCTNELGEAARGAEIVLGVVPSHLTRGVYEKLLPEVQEQTIFVSATKGLENESLLRTSQIMEEILSKRFRPRIAVLSGPTFAREVAALNPTVVVIASPDVLAAARVQVAFSSSFFRLYTSTDVVGVEIGGAVKNVVAIGAGVVHGMGLAQNTLAALITRGLAEITRLAVALGGSAATLAGLAGLGDLVLTCTGELSRNRTVGIELAKGRSLDEIVRSMKMVAEGVKTTSATLELARRCGVEMPITEQMYQMLHNGLPPREAIRRLMERPLREE